MLPSGRQSATDAPSVRVKGGFDANLDFPLTDPYWASFFATGRWEIASTSDLDALTDLLLKQRLDFSYLPSANCFFLRGARAYRGLASALSVRTRVPAQSSVLVVRGSSPVASWHELRGARLGYINTYCTTSYFAPAILLAREGLALGSFFDAFAVAPWQGQIDAVVDGAIDATMVYEDVWLARADNARRTKVIARLDDLPTPAFVVRSTVDAATAEKLKEALLAFAPPSDATLLYAGFADYQEARMQRFFAELETIPDLPS
jgi:phosphonate transport system substrate-binding protein